MKYLERSTVFDVYRGETVNASLLIEELNMVTEDIEAWMERSDEAEEAVAFLRQQLKAAMTSSGTQSYNTGRQLHEVGERQRRRKVAEVKESTRRALWFIGSFGLTIDSVSMHDSTDTSLTLSYGESPEPAATSNPSDTTLYQMLFLLERFGVSDDFYHGLAMVHSSLPRLKTSLPYQ